MSSRIFRISETPDWKHAYMAAILEKNPTCVIGLIHQAREKLSARLHELTTLSPFPSDEIEAIHDAFYLLQALHSSLPYRDEAGALFDAAKKVA